MRHELTIVGLIIVLVGIGLVIVGYNKLQPSIMERAVQIVEELSGNRAPSELKHNREEGYILIGVGILTFFFGIAIILKSRNPSTRQYP